jgi:hypothetical protein
MSNRRHHNYPHRSYTTVESDLATVLTELFIKLGKAILIFGPLLFVMFRYL